MTTVGAEGRMSCRENLVLLAPRLVAGGAVTRTLLLLRMVVPVETRSVAVKPLDEARDATVTT